MAVVAAVIEMEFNSRVGISLSWCEIFFEFLKEVALT